MFSFSAFANDPGVQVDVTLSPAGSFKIDANEVSGSAFKTATGVEAENVEVTLTNLTTGIGLRDKHTKERLMVQKFPKAKLVKAVGKNGKGTAIIEIKGKKQKVEGTYTIDGNMLNAQFPMNLPALDIKDVRYMGIGVKDTVTVHISLPLQAARKTAGKSK